MVRNLKQGKGVRLHRRDIKNGDGFFDDVGDFFTKTIPSTAKKAVNTVAKVIDPKDIAKTAISTGASALGGIVGGVPGAFIGESMGNIAGNAILGKGISIQPIRAVRKPMFGQPLRLEGSGRRGRPRKQGQGQGRPRKQGRGQGRPRKQGRGQGRPRGRPRKHHIEGDGFFGDVKKAFSKRNLKKVGNTIGDVAKKSLPVLKTVGKNAIAMGTQAIGMAMGQAGAPPALVNSVVSDIQRQGNSLIDKGKLTGLKKMSTVNDLKKVVKNEAIDLIDDALDKVNIPSKYRDVAERLLDNVETDEIVPSWVNTYKYGNGKRPRGRPLGVKSGNGFIELHNQMTNFNPLPKRVGGLKQGKGLYLNGKGLYV